MPFLPSVAPIVAYEDIKDFFTYPLTQGYPEQAVSTISVRTYISYIARCIRNCNSAEDIDRLREWDDEVMWFDYKAKQGKPIPKETEDNKLEVYKLRQANKYRPISAAYTYESAGFEKLVSELNELVKKWNARFLAVRNRQVELRDFIQLGLPYVREAPPTSGATQEMGRWCCEAEINDISENLFRQAGKFTESYKWFYDPSVGEKDRAQNIDSLNNVTHHLRVKLVNTAKALMLGQARFVADEGGPITMAIQKKQNEAGCFGIHGDVLVYFNRLVVSVSFAKKGSTQFTPIELAEGARSQLL